jgi:hypothetical protein
MPHARKQPAFCDDFGLPRTRYASCGTEELQRHLAIEPRVARHVDVAEGAPSDARAHLEVAPARPGGIVIDLDRGWALLLRVGAAVRI